MVLITIVTGLINQLSYVMFVWKLIVVDAPRSFLPGPVAKRAGIGTGIAAEVVGEDQYSGHQGSPVSLGAGISSKLRCWWFGTFFIFPYIGKNHPN